MLGLTGLLATVSAGSGQPPGPPPAAPSGRPVYDVRNYGAAGDGSRLDSPAFNRAIDACHEAGGGVVYAPPGTYLAGTVVLKSNVTLYLEAGATLLGSTKFSDYAPQPGPSALGDANQSHLLFAREAENVGVAGPGRIDGQGQSYWQPSGRKPLPPSDDWRDVAAHDWKPTRRRPSPMLEFVNCRWLRIEDVRIENAAGWTMRPYNCDDVFVRGVSVKNPVYGCNTDGIDVTGCRNVFISNCSFDTGDDAICLKSESPYGGEPRTMRNVTIDNCILTTCCNGLKIGTATRGGFENIVFTNSVIYNNDVNPRARVIAGIAIEMVDGGWVEGVSISNIRMQRTRTPIFIRRGNRRPRKDGSPGRIRGVMIDTILASEAILTSSVTGLPGFPVEDVTLSNIRIDSGEAGEAAWSNRQVPENPRSYPEARMFGRLPSYGLYARHVAGLTLRHFSVRGAKTEARPAIACEDVKSLDVDALRSTPIQGTEPVVRLTDVQDAFLTNCLAPQGTSAFVEARGANTSNVALMGSNLRGAAKALSISPEVPAGAAWCANSATA